MHDITKWFKATIFESRSDAVVSKNFTIVMLLASFEGLFIYIACLGYITGTIGYILFESISNVSLSCYFYVYNNIQSNQLKAVIVFLTICHYDFKQFHTFGKTARGYIPCYRMSKDVKLFVFWPPLCHIAFFWKLEKTKEQNKR